MAIRCKGEGAALCEPGWRVVNHSLQDREPDQFDEMRRQYRLKGESLLGKNDSRNDEQTRQQGQRQRLFCC